jgi:hypothetical protein
MTPNDRIIVAVGVWLRRIPTSSGTDAGDHARVLRRRERDG